MKKLFLLFVSLLFVGCAAGNKYDYQSSSMVLPVKPFDQKALVLSVEDWRPYVLSGKVDPSFVGLQRGGYGNPFDVNTLTGKPMTEDMSAAIAKGLSDVGYSVENLQGKPDNVYLMNVAMKNGATRIVVLKVYEWKSDIYMGITLHCDLRLSVFDANMELLAANNMQFVEEIGGGKIGAARNSQALTDEFSKRIGYLFNKDDIRSSLQ